jgi:hypothetical protein
LKVAEKVLAKVKVVTLEVRDKRATPGERRREMGVGAGVQ